MARHAAEARDVSEVTTVDFPFTFKKTIAPKGSTVVLKGNFEADFDSGSEEDIHRGWKTEHPMAETTDGEFRVTVPTLRVGEEYQYKFFIIQPGGKKLEYPAGEGRNEKIRIKAPEEPSPSDSRDIKEVRAAVKSRLHTMLDASGNFESMRDFEALFDDFRAEIEAMGITTDISPLLMMTWAECFREATYLPSQIKAEFPTSRPVRDRTDLTQRYKKGANQYRRKVFELLRNNPEAKKLLKLEKERASYNPVNPLGTPELNRKFQRFCSEVDRSHFVLSDAFDQLGSIHKPAASPVEADNRRQIFMRAASHLTPEQRKALSQVPNGLVGGAIDAAVQAGWLWQVGYFSWAGAGGFAAKALLETGLGIGLKDAISALRKNPQGERDWKLVTEIIKKNNILARLFFAKNEKGKWDGWNALKAKGKEFLARSIPFVSMKYDPSSSVERSEIADPSKVDEVIQTACRDASSK